MENYSLYVFDILYKGFYNEFRKRRQVATAWAIAKGTLPIIGVTKTRQVEEAADAAQICLTEEEVGRLEKLGG